ncbi:hypothetical protein ACFB49_10930 [Sphingomonas sp. DBB INV C78]|uniref:hypothetical protein n=1 Tax=Sphingomonas sp. DBB INV C78 TaxID=3349434 RepID=UPI0036D3A6AA
MSGTVLHPQAHRRQSRLPLLSSCALGTVMAALGHQPAVAQSFQGSVIGTPTGATVSTAPGQTIVTVNAPNAIVNWRPTDTGGGTAPIQFQPVDTTATFESTGGNYTVLNRILPGGAAAGRSVLLNGGIESFVGSRDGGPRGGAVWFYSPNGLIIGSQASIDVGSLLLTTRDLSDADFLDGNGIYNFGATDNSRSTINIQAGATINALHDADLATSSYVALVAPRIVQGGDVRVDGSAAYVAAEQASITINGSLFDIQVQSGSDASAGDDVTLDHTGSTGGVASTGASDPQAIYMVAIPKNVAITMLVGGNVGYDAGSAGIDNGVVVLSAGQNVGQTTGITAGPASGVGANFTVTAQQLSSDTTIVARTNALVDVADLSSGTDLVAGNLVIQGGASSTLQIRDGASAQFIVPDTDLDGFGLIVRTSNTDDSSVRIRGTAAVQLGTNASLETDRGLNISARVDDNGIARGGFANLTAGTGSSILVDNGLFIDAAGSSQQADAFGGNVQVQLTGATLTAGSLFVDASGGAGFGPNGANATGGTVTVSVNNSTISAVNGIVIDAGGFGGGAFDGGVGGIGRGGSANLTVSGAASSISSLANLEIRAAGFGGGDATDGSGNGIAGGDGFGGSASFIQQDGSVSVDTLVVDAAGRGGNGVDSEDLAVRGGAAGQGVGGTATLTTTGGSLAADTFDILAFGEGGDGGAGVEAGEVGYGTGTSPDGGDAGAATGGTAIASIGSTLNGVVLNVNANAIAGQAGSSDFGDVGNGADAFAGGAAGAGGATLAFTGSTTTTLTATNVTASAVGSGGLRGGTALGGDAVISRAGTGVARLGTTSFDVSATGGSASLDGAQAGDASAGEGSILVSGGLLELDTLDFQVDAVGGSTFFGGAGGIGGDATGGIATIDVAGGSFTLATSLAVQADGQGGGGVTAGFGRGGRVDFAVGPGGFFSLNDASDLLLTASGTGGNGSGSQIARPAEIGGDGFGGTVTFQVASASIDITDDLRFDASGIGGSTTGTGGNATGGTITASVVGGGSVTVDGELVVNAVAIGGNAVIGGSADAGDIDLSVSSNGIFQVADLTTIRASGSGGLGAYDGDGGAGSGGSFAITVASGSTGSSIALDGGLDVAASGFGGGSQQQGFSGTGNGGQGGLGTGGSISLRNAGGSLSVTDVTTLRAEGFGGDTRDIGDAGAGAGGSILVDAAAGTSDLDSLLLSVSGSGGVAGEFGYGTGGNGGTGTGGSAVITVGTGSLGTTGITLAAGGFGGDGGSGDLDGTLGLINGGRGGDGTGGTASITIASGTLTSGSVNLSVDGDAGNGGNGFSGATAGVGGVGTAGGFGGGPGGATLAITGGGSFESSDLFLSALGSGGGGGFSDVIQPDLPSGADGGAAFGGLARITVSDGSLTTTFTTLDARAFGGNADFGSSTTPPAIGGSATGGTAELLVGAAGSASFDSLSATSFASAGGFFFTRIGNAQGGTSRVSIDGGTLVVTSFLDLNAGAEGERGIGLGPTIAGGTAIFEALNGATVDYSGNLRIDASATIFSGEGGFFQALSGDDIGILGVGDGTAVGGTATMTLDGVSLDLGGDLTLDASGSAQAPGASAQGGTATLVVRNGGALTVGGDTELDASGFGADGDSGGSGIGGTVTLRADAGTIAAGQIFLDASGTGGSSFVAAPGGSASGGAILIDIASSATQAGSISAGSLNASAGAEGGSGDIDTFADTSSTSGGDATGGSITVTAAGALTVTDGIILDAAGNGGAAFAGGVGGTGTGGTIAITTSVSGAGVGNISAAAIDLAASGTGGVAIDPSEFTESDLDLTAASGGTGIGGGVTLTLGGGSITGAINASISGTGQDGAASLDGQGGAGGSATGGSFALIRSGGTLAGGYTADIGATAGNGGVGRLGGAGGAGGSAVGGSFNFSLIGDGQSFTLADPLNLILAAVGGAGGDAIDGTVAGGAGGAGGSATGGNLILAVSGDGASLTLAGLSLDATATGGVGGNGGGGTQGGAGGAGGLATGGTALLSADLGTLTIADGGRGTTIDVSATGGLGGTGGSATDGSGSVGGTGGNALAGNIDVRATGGSIVADTLALTSVGRGGDGGVGGTGGASGTGGAGAGGRIRLATLDDSDTGATGSITAGFTNLVASSIAGSGALPGQETAGRIEIYQQSAAASGFIQFASLNATAQGTSLDSAVSAIDLLADGGTIRVTDSAFLDAGGYVFLRANGAGVIVGDLLAVSSDQFIVGSHSQPSGSGDTIRARQAFFSAVTDVDLGNGTTVRAGDITASAGRNIVLATAIADNDIDLSAAGAITATTLRAGDDIIVNGGSIAIGSATTTGLGVDDETGYGGDGLGNVYLTATDGILFDASAGDGVDVDAFGQLLLSSGGDTAFGELVSADAGMDIIAQGRIDGAAASLVTGGAARFYVGDGNLTLTSLDAGSLATLDAEGGEIVGNGLALAGAVTITDLLRLRNGDILVSADQGITIGRAEAQSGAALTLASANGTVSLTSNGAIGGGLLEAISITGTSISTGDLAAADSIAITATASDYTAGSLTTATGDITVQAAGLVTLDTVRAGGDVSLTSTNGLVAVTTDLSAGGQIDAIGTSVTLVSLGGLNIDTLRATDGDILVQAGGAIALGDPQATGNITITNGVGMEGDPDAALTITANSLNAGGNVLVSGQGDIAVQSANAGGDVVLSTASAASLDSGTAGRDLVINVQTAIAAGDLVAGRDLELVTRLAGGDTRILPRSITLASGRAGDDIILAGFGQVEAGTLVTTGTGEDAGGLQYGNPVGSSVYIISEMGTAIQVVNAADNIEYFNTAETRDGFMVSDGSGGITVGRQTAGGNIRALNTHSGIDFQDVIAGGTISLDAGQSQAADVRLVTAQAGQSIGVTARGLVTLGGDIAAPDISVASHDITLFSGEGGTRIGIDTDTITLTNIGPRRSQIGGAAAGDAWSLSNDEFGRLSAHTITLAADTSDITVGQLDIIGSAGQDTATRRRNLTGSDLVIRSEGVVLVNGAVSLIGAGADDRLTLSAGNRVMVDTAGGSVSLTGQGGALGGTLIFDAGTIFVGTTQAWADIQGMSDINAKDERLGNSDGINNPEGFIRANGLEFRASNGVYIQNTGTDRNPSGERAGFTAGSGGVTIVSKGDGAPIEIVINGRQLLADGSFASGADLIPLLILRGEGDATMASFNPRSTANGCLIVGFSCRFDLPERIGIPQQDIITALDPEEDFDGETGLVRAINQPVIQFAEATGLSSEPVIEEPVTGSGNEDLWTGGGADGGTEIQQQVTGTRKDDEDEGADDASTVNQQVTGTRNENLDEQVTGTRNEAQDDEEQPKPQ